MNEYQEEMLRLISILACKLPQESLTDVNEQLRKIDQEYEKVEKALDKACEKLARTDACWDLSEKGCDYECASCWKKYFLGEEEQ